MTDMKPNEMMVVAVIETTLDPCRQALLRSSGSSGLRIFGEVNRRGRVAVISVSGEEGADSIVEEEGGRPSLSIPVSTPPHKRDTLTLSFAALRDSNHPWARRNTELAPIRSSTIQQLSLVHTGEITAIQPFFLHANSSLTSFETEDLPRVTTITASFLEGSRLLRHLDLKPFAHVVHIGPSFMAGCVALIDIDLTPLTVLKEIGNDFLGGCSALERVTLSPSVAIHSLGDLFVSECPSLKAINLGGAFLKGLDSVPCKFISACSLLEKIDFGSTPIAATTIESRFLFRSKALETINLSAFTNVTSIHGDFLLNCISLKTIDLSPLLNVTSITACFLAKCTALTEIDLSPLGNVQSIGVGFLEGCSGITRIDLQPIGGAALAGSFMNGCTGLREVDVSTIKVHPTSWFKKCTDITLLGAGTQN